jgi:hypothetical protein
VDAEAEGFAQFVEARQRALQRTAWLLTGDWALAEDLVQTALVRRGRGGSGSGGAMTRTRRGRRLPTSLPTAPPSASSWPASGSGGKGSPHRDWRSRATTRAQTDSRRTA